MISMSWSSDAVLAEAVEKCCDINSLVVINGELVSQLMVACYHGNPDYVQDLLGVPGIKVDLQNSEGRHALMCASELGHTKVVEVLLNTCQPPQDVINLRDKKGTTALMIASGENHAEIVLLLLQSGAFVNLQDNKGWSALMIASRNGCTATVLLLIQNGADVNMQNNDGYSCLRAASNYHHNKIASLLIQNGAFETAEGKDASRVHSGTMATLFSCFSRFPFLPCWTLRP